MDGPFYRPGSVTLSDGRFTYTPDADFHGTDWFGQEKQGQALFWQRRRNKGLLTARGSLPRHWGIGGMSPGC